MTNQPELTALISKARENGAIIRTKIKSGLIDAVQVRFGIPDCGGGWMSLISAAEKLRVFTAVATA